MSFLLLRRVLSTSGAWLALTLFLTSSTCLGQEQYSRSAEYRQMMEELHAPAPSPAFIATGQRPSADSRLKPEVEEDSSMLKLATAASEFALDKSTAQLTWRNKRTKASWIVSASGCDSPSKVTGISRTANSWTIAIAGSCGSGTMMLDLMTDTLSRLSLTRAGDADSKVLRMHVDGEQPLFGLGERFWQAALSNTELDVRPQDRSSEPGHNWVYVAIPFVYGPGGLGLYADTAFDTRFRFNAKGSSFDLAVANNPVSLYLFAEADPKAVLSAYTALTGRPQSPPLWTFGPWVTALQGEGAVLEIAHQLRVDAVPASALWVYDQLDEKNNLGWPFWFGSYYGDPRAFTDILHGQGYQVLTYVHPYVRQQVLPYTNLSPAYNKGVAEKLLVTGADGKPAGPRFELVNTGNVDFTNPAAVDWWQSMITSAVRDQGFNGWMEDFGEWVRDSDRFAAGDGTILSELYPLLYHKVSLRVAQAINPAVVPFSRSGAPGSQQFSPVLWGGDQAPNWSRDYGLPSVVTAGITAGMSGFSSWGPDIFSAGDSRDLWIRWVEFGALTPVMCDHVWSKPNGSYNLFTDADTEAIFRKYAVLHSTLLPYLATYAEEAHRTGIPIMRHTVLEYPDDPRSATAEYQYLLGTQLLVAPIVEGGAQTRRLYLPRGEWLNYWTGDPLTGGQDVTIPAPTDQIPILVRAGSVLPFKPETEAARWNWTDPHLLETSLVWKAYLSLTGAAEGAFTLPNGTSARFEQRGGTATITGKSKTDREYEIILRSKLKPTSVSLDGVVLQDSVSGSRAQWWWNPGSGEIHVIFRSADFSLSFQGVTATQYTQ